MPLGAGSKSTCLTSPTAQHLLGLLGLQSMLLNCTNSGGGGGGDINASQQRWATSCKHTKTNQQHHVLDGEARNVRKTPRWS